VPFTIETITTMPVVIPDATAATDGLMSAADKAKLDAIPATVTLASVYNNAASTADNEILMTAGKGPIVLESDLTSTFVIRSTDGTNTYFEITSDGTQEILSGATDGATTVGLIFDTATSWTTAGNILVDVRSGGTTKWKLARSAGGFHNMLMPSAAGLFNQALTSGVQVFDSQIRLTGGSGAAVIGGRSTKSTDLGSTSHVFRNLFSALVPTRTATAGDYTMVNGDGTIGVTSTAAPRTITLLAASAIAGRWVAVVDESGGAAANNITITSASTIRGTGGTTINSAYGTRLYYSTGTEWISFIL
jgi:hypothetical protein